MIMEPANLGKRHRVNVTVSWPLSHLTQADIQSGTITNIQVISLMEPPQQIPFDRYHLAILTVHETGQHSA